MRFLLRFLRRPRSASARHARPRPPNVGAYYRSATSTPLSVNQVRERQFPLARRGLDPAEVHSFLHRVANELAAARAELVRTREENVRIKRALRDWQARFGGRARV